MTGNITRRGDRSWRLKFSLGTDLATGKGKTAYKTIRGTKKEAQVELVRLLNAAQNGGYVDSSRITISEFFDRWERDWAANHLSGKSIERYKEIADSYIRSRIGGIVLQKLRPVDLAELYATLLREGRKSRGAGLSHASVRYVHRVLHRALGHAVVWQIIPNNPAAAVDVPLGTASEIEIMTEDQVRSALGKLRGRPMYVIAALGLATGMRRGELLALRWRNVDFDTDKLRVEQSLERKSRTPLQAAEDEARPPDNLTPDCYHKRVEDAPPGTDRAAPRSWPGEGSG